MPRARKMVQWENHSNSMSMADRLGRPPAVGENRRPVIARCLDTFRAGPIVGIEYLVELHDKDFHTYECVLCGQTGNGNHLRNHSVVMQHMVSFKHRVAFLKLHFPKSIKPAAKLLAMPCQPSEWLCSRIEFICADIERRKGRASLAVIKTPDFKENRDKWVKLIKDSNHFRENKVIMAFDSTELRNEFKRVGISSGRSRSRSRSPHDKRSMRRTEDSQKYSEEHQGETYSKRSSKFSTVFGRSHDDDEVVLAEYRRQYTEMYSQIMGRQAQHHTDPQSHPMYPSEWNLFWTARSEELTQEGKDPYEQDFSREWSLYWVERVSRLDEEEIERREMEIRTALNLPFDLDIPVQILVDDPEPSHEHREKVDDLLHVSEMEQREPRHGLENERERQEKQREVEFRGQRNRSDRKRGNNFDHEVSAEVLDRKNRFEQKNERKSRFDKDRKDEYAGAKAETPRDRWQPIASDLQKRTSEAREPPVTTRFDTENRQDISRIPKSTRRDERSTNPKPALQDEQHLSHERDHQNAPQDIPKKPDSVVLMDIDESTQDPVTVISVLRLLAAFEDILGNRLGPQVVDLLSKAVALEKVRANLADDLLMSSDNSILLDTVKEKMKGLLLTGVVEPFKVPAVRKVIAHVNKINQIINMRIKADEKKAMKAMKEARINLEIAETKEKEREAERRKVEFRNDISKQLASSMALQGKTITPEQLDALTNVYIEKHTPSDTPYLFGLQMGSRFPNIHREDDLASHQRNQPMEGYGMNLHEHQTTRPSNFGDNYSSGSGAAQYPEPLRWNNPHRSSRFSNSSLPVFSDSHQSNYRPVLNIRPNLTEQRPIFDDHPRSSGSSGPGFYNNSNNFPSDQQAGPSQYGLFSDRTVAFPRNEQHDRPTHGQPQYSEYDHYAQMEQFNQTSVANQNNEMQMAYDNIHAGQMQQPYKKRTGISGRSGRAKAVRMHNNPNVKNVH